MESGRVINFAAGPSKLPLEVLKKARDEFLNYDNSGMSIMEMSHRGAEFSRIMNTTEESFRNLLSIPDNYKVLLLQGGGLGQFAAVPMNLINRNPARKADYLVTGTWSAKAAKEAEKYGTVNMVLPKRPDHTSIPEPDTWTVDPNASYVYYCDNETISGVEFPIDHVYNNVPADIPIVCDMSSNIMSRPIDISKFGLIYGGAQKNIGISGVVVVIIREDLLKYALPITPAMVDYKTQVGNNSMLNTPPTFNIYIMGLVLEWIERQGGVNAMYEESLRKSARLYKVIDESNGFYKCVIDPKYRSRMNVTFRIDNGNDDLEKRFVAEADKLHFKQLKGHRSVGGMRASIYNAMSFNETDQLAVFMEKFARSI